MSTAATPIWQHPDLLPTAEDLEDPKGFSERRKLAEASDSEVDDALQKLLSGGFDEPAAPTPRTAEGTDSQRAPRSPTTTAETGESGTTNRRRGRTTVRPTDRGPSRTDGGIQPKA